MEELPDQMVVDVPGGVAAEALCFFCVSLCFLFFVGAYISE